MRRSFPLMGRAAAPAAASGSGHLSRPVLMVVCGSLLTALYLACTVRLALPHYFPGPRGVSLGFPEMLSPDWRRVSAQYVSVALLAFALYGVALYGVWRGRGRIPVALLFGFPVLFTLALLWMYPPTAVDMFHYQADARTFWVHGANPLTVPPLAYPYAIGISWAEQPSPYGPAWSLLTAMPALLPGDHYLAGLLLFKVLAGAFYLGCAWLLYRIVAELRPGWQAFAVVLFAWNPFVVFRTVGNGHNDLVMMFFVLLALERTQRRDWPVVLPALALSVLVKFVSALLVPMFLWYAWEHTPGTVRQRARALAPGLGLALLVTVLCYVPFWDGRATFATVLSQANNNRLLITSTPLLIQTRLAAALGPVDSADAARTISRAAFLLLYVPLVWQSRRDLPRLAACSVNALFLYLVVAAAWYRPWYMLWPVTLAAVLPGTWFTPLLLTVTVFGSFPDLVEQYRSHWGWLAADYWRAVVAPVWVAFWPPLLVWYYGLLTFRSWHFDAPWRARHGPRDARLPRGR